ncbi:MAG: DUF4293 family protein [Ginsengibacter sp.]
MIQRVQTLWLLLATIAVFLTLQFSFYSGTLISNNSFHSFIAKDNFILMVLTSALGTTLLINIFLFKHRTIQLKISIIAIMVEILIIFLYTREIKQFSHGTLDIWAVFHLVTLVSLLLAASGIYKDQRLIKDSNRLR